ncbi:MAG: U3 snoRNP protein [Peltula sp. TS41687]|nr:MAG: U3 snoRNP protein [Peltula sp. TS41687]
MPALSKSISTPPQRHPQPTFFLGPPSRDSSRISLPAVLLPGAQASSIGAPFTPSQLGTSSIRSVSSFNSSIQDSSRVTTNNAFSPGTVRHYTPTPSSRRLQVPRRRWQGQERRPRPRQTHADRMESLWAEMQMRLEDVELTATGNETHLFGAEHAKALEELRTAQITLAQAWANSEADEAEEVNTNPEEVVTLDSSRPTSSADERPNENTDGATATTGGLGSADEKAKEKITAEDQTENDFVLARKRREANDRFFDRVSAGVSDVVAKLEEVAAAMRVVERESRDIWDTDHPQMPSSDMDDSKLQPFFTALSNSPHDFLQPTQSLHAAALELTKIYLDPLASSVSEVQLRRQQQNGRLRKRKRGEGAKNGGQQMLRLKKLHVEGLDVEQVWGQVRLILDATMEELGGVEDLKVEMEKNVKRQRRIGIQPGVDGSELESDEDEDSELERSVVDEDGEDSLSSADVSDGVEDGEGEGESDQLSSIDDIDEDVGFEDENPAQSDMSVHEDEMGPPDLHEERPEDDIVADDDQATSETVAEDPSGLNDGFFSLEEFNKQSQFLERQDLAGTGFNFGGSDDESIDWHADPMSGRSKNKTKQNRNDDDDGEEDGPTFDDMDLDAPEGESDEDEDDTLETGLNDHDNTNEIRYADYFAPPSRKVKVKGNRPEKSKRVDRPPNKQNDQEEHAKEDDIQRTMEAVRRDLFEDDVSADEESVDKGKSVSDPKAQRSTHERRQAQLAEEIRKLELANVSKKEWTVSGEARAADRPLNSLLAEDLEFERTGKPVPIITAEVSESIESLIKRRIIAQEFDELIRRRPDDLLLQGPLSNEGGVRRGLRGFELDDNKAQQSLAELYEEDHLRKADPQSYKDKNSEKLRKEHEEIEGLWKDVCGKLDALSNWHYKPKPPRPSVTIVAGVPTIAMEDARPSAAMVGGGQESMLAPQEVYAPGRDSVGGVGEVVLKSGVPVAREEMSREEKGRRRRRGKERLKKKKKKLDGKGGLEKQKAGDVAGNKSGGRDAVINTLKRGGVQVIGKKGEVRDVLGQKIKEQQKPSGVGSFKL